MGEYLTEALVYTEKQRVYNLAKFYSRESDRFEYKNLQKQVSQTFMLQYKAYFNNIVSKIKPL